MGVTTTTTTTLNCGVVTTLKKIISRQRIPPAEKTVINIVRQRASSFGRQKSYFRKGAVVPTVTCLLLASARS